jgi:hypothetical protein
MEASINRGKRGTPNSIERVCRSGDRFLRECRLADGTGRAPKTNPISG